MGADVIKGKPWARIPGETGKAFAAFVIYLELGKARSAAKALVVAGSKPGNRRHWERWASKNNWRPRAEAYDADQLHEQIAGRHIGREQVRQAVYNESAEIIAELRDLSIGKVRAGDRKIKTSRSGAPIMTMIEDPDNPGAGAVVEVAVTEELVSPKVRAQILEHLLAIAGVMAPKRTEIKHVDPARDELRAALKSFDPELMAGLAAALSVER